MMRWRTAHASVKGTSHDKTGMPCQDRAAIDLLDGGGLLLLVCDGAGSTSHGGEGADEAIAACRRFLGACRPGTTLDKAWGLACLEAVRTHLVGHARKREIPLREFSATFLAVIVREGKTLTIHVGDGGIVLEINGEWVVSPPRSAGEYINQTYFVTQSEHNAQIRVLPGSPTRISAFSDGVETMALNLREKTVHEPFFASLFATLEQNDASPDEFNQAVTRFLSTDDVNERTDDDKTLAVAVRLTEEATNGQGCSSRPAARSRSEPVKSPEAHQQPKVGDKGSIARTPTPGGNWREKASWILLGALLLALIECIAVGVYFMNKVVSGTFSPEMKERAENDAGRVQNRHR